MLTKIHSKYVMGLILLSAILMVVGCTGSKQYGRYRIDDQVKADFEAYRVFPQYAYFFSGPQNFPRAIIGVDKNYELVSRFWKPIDLTERQLTKWIQNITHVGVGSHKFDGYTMLAPQGDPVGIWYSSREFTNLYVVGDKQITVTPPPDSKRRSSFGLGGDDD